jgi:F0F1-type ATP synthase assembly protein I
MKNGKQQNQANKTEKARDLGTYIVNGFITGALIGIITDNLIRWMGTGMCLGIVIGAVSEMRTDQSKE